MAKRTLKRQLTLFQVIMLGTAGTLGSGIFVLTGLAAEVAGPATFVAILVGGFLSFSIALNYSELATIYPETGGAMTYVREAWGKGLLSFLIGSMDSISSTFYCALSAIGFSYSLSVFFPNIPIIPVAIAVVIIFVILNILGVSNVGNVQIVMGASLLFAFTVFIIAGFISPAGFQPSILLPGGKVFISDDLGMNIKVLMRTIALIYAAYVGFEVIADDAEEVKNPSKVIPIAILVSLVIITIVYSLTVVVTLGTVPWQSVAGSKTALTDAIKVFLPGWGVTIIGIAGMVGALTSINSSMLSATRETFTLSRDGVWPRILSRLNSSRVPFMAILFVGIVSILIAVIGIVDFLSYITSAGYLFVLFFSNMAMIQLHKKYPNIHRPFKAPLFPLTPILASLTCIIVIIFSDIDALIFTAGIIFLFTIYYYGRQSLQLWNDAHKRDLSPGRWRIILPITTPAHADGLLKVGTLLAESEKDLNMCLLTVLPTTAQTDQQISGDYVEKIKVQRHAVLEKFIHYAVDRNVPMYTKMVSDLSFEDGIINEIKNDSNVKLLLLRWPGEKKVNLQYTAAVKRLMTDAGVNIGILYDRGINKFQNIMVPVGGGFHSRLAIHLANDIAMQEGANVDYFRIIPKEIENNEETNQDEISLLQEIVMTELGENPVNASLRLIPADSIYEAVIQESETNEYDLTIIGSADIQNASESLFGQVSETVAEKSRNSVLVVHRHDNPTASWMRHQLKHYQKS
jgi:amino acid transporter/nucleotide-binding universal stress UspA family protein